MQSGPARRDHRRFPSHHGNRFRAAKLLPHLTACAGVSAAAFAGVGTTCPGVSVGASPGGMNGSWCAMPLWQSMQVFSLLAR
jgi:hypothetical protein